MFRLVKIYNYDDDLGLPKFGVLRQLQPKHSEKKCAADCFAAQPADASFMRRLKRTLLLVYTNERPIGLERRIVHALLCAIAGP